MKSRPRRLAVATTVPAIVALSIVTAPAALATGGCDPHTGGSVGWDVGVCLDNHGSRDSVEADMYVNTRPGGLAADCKVYLEVYAGSTKIGWNDRGDACSVHYHHFLSDGGSVTPLPAGCARDVHSHAYYRVGGKTYHLGDSPRNISYNC
jgi:hypothetical protein